MELGSIKFWSKKKEFGFITKNNKDFYFNKKSISCDYDSFLFFIKYHRITINFEKIIFKYIQLRKEPTKYFVTELFLPDKEYFDNFWIYLSIEDRKELDKHYPQIALAKISMLLEYHIPQLKEKVKNIVNNFNFDEYASKIEMKLGIMSTYKAGDNEAFYRTIEHVNKGEHEPYLDELHTYPIVIYSDKGFASWHDMAKEYFDTHDEKDIDLHSAKLDYIKTLKEKYK